MWGSVYIIDIERLRMKKRKKIERANPEMKRKDNMKKI